MTLNLRGSVSWFGGPEDMGVAPDEGLAFIYDVATAPHLFLATQPDSTTGLARRLNPNVPYIAVRWDYDEFPKDMLASMNYLALVRAPFTGRQFRAWPADWGPHEDTGRVADISWGLLEYLGIMRACTSEQVFSPAGHVDPAQAGSFFLPAGHARPVISSWPSNRLICSLSSVTTSPRLAFEM